MVGASGTDTRIDVLIPAYNVGSTIVDALQSILRQTLRAIKVIVVDDGSTDDTGEKLARMAEADSRVVIITQANAGIVDALNIGLLSCSSEFIARHDGDDIAFPERLEKQLAYLDAHADCIAVGANAYHIDEHGRRMGKRSYMTNPQDADVSWYPAAEPYLMHPLLLIRRQALDAVGGYRHVFHAEDADLFWRLLGLGRLHNMPDLLADYRIHTNSVSGKSVLNGRVQAVNSQLAAMSHKRRLAGKPDLVFDKDRLREFVEARNIGDIMRIAESQLDDEERRQFRLMVAGKMLELESYRPYELDSDDRVFIKKAIAFNTSLMVKDNLRLLGHRQARYAAKLLARGKAHAASEIVRPSLLWPLVELVSTFVIYKVGLGAKEKPLAEP